MADNCNSPSAEYNDQNSLIAGKWVRFACYGLLGWCFEVVWTALADKFSGTAQGWDLTGHSYLWMFPIYGLAAWLYEPAHNRLRKKFFLLRACIYAAGIMTVEYITGGLLLLITGHCPWDYSQIAFYHIHGLVRLEAFPVWAAVGLALEPTHDFLTRLSPVIIRELFHKKTIYKSFSILLLFVIFAGGCSYTKNLTELNRKQALEDVDFLVENFKAIHAKPFHHILEADFDAHVRKLKKSLKKTNTRKNFSLKIARLLALAGDSHTQSGFPDLYLHAEQKNTWFPIYLRYDNTVNISGWFPDFTPKRIKKGDVLLSLNNLPIEHWIEKYQPYVSAETTMQKKQTIAERFLWFLYLAEEQQDSFSLDLIDADGQLYSETVPVIQLISSQKNSKKILNKNWAFTFHNKGRCCHFKVRSFFIGAESDTNSPTFNAWKSTLDNLLTQMKQQNTEILIVDLRGNGGGNGALGHKLLRCVTQKTFLTGAKTWRYSKAYQQACLKYGLMHRKIPAWLHLENVLDLRDYKRGPRKDQLDGEYSYPGPNRTVKPYKKAWDGQLVVITDRNTFSAAKDFALIVKDNQLGLIAGEETGGRASEYTDIAPLTLPNSGISCQIATAYILRPAGYDDGRGVFPDLQLDTTLKDEEIVDIIVKCLATK